VRVVRDRPRLTTSPDADERDGLERWFIHAPASRSRHDAAAAGAVQHDRAVERGAVIRSHTTPLDADTGARGGVEQNRRQHGGVDLPAALAAGESFDALISGAPPHRVASGADKTGRIDGIAHAEEVEQLAAAWRKRLRERADDRRLRTGDQADGVTPQREQARSGSSSGPAAEDNDGRRYAAADGTR
jgi:hypothetical protein